MKEKFQTKNFNEESKKREEQDSLRTIYSKKISPFAYPVDKNEEKVLKAGAHYGDAGTKEKTDNLSESRTKELALKIHTVDEIKSRFKKSGKDKLSSDEKLLLLQYEKYDNIENPFHIVESFRKNIKKFFSIKKRIGYLNRKENNLNSTEQEVFTRLQQEAGVLLAKIKELTLSLGPFLEYNHRTYIREQRTFQEEFLPLQKEISRMNVNVEELNTEAEYEQKAYETALTKGEKKEAEVLQHTRSILAKGSVLDLLESDNAMREYLSIASFFGNEDDVLKHIESLVEMKEGNNIPYKYLSQEELRKKKKEAEQQLNTLWKDEYIRYFAKKEYIKNLIAQDIRGEKSLEIPEMIKVMNKISATEKVQSVSTCISAVLIGPPGTGKSMVAEHFFRNHPNHKDKKQPPERFTMTKETTEYTLFGGHAIDVRDETQVVRMFQKIFDAQNYAKTEEDKKNLNNEAENLIFAFLNQSGLLRAEIGIDNIFSNPAEVPEGVRTFVAEKARIALADWQAKELGKLTYGNDWKMGVIMRAVAEGRDIIIDEYNNFETPPDELRDLLETPYGGVWRHAKSGKEFIVHSHIILTANEGVKAGRFDYGANELTSALANRLLSPIEMGEPSSQSELLVAQVELSDEEANLLLKKQIDTIIARIGAEEDIKYELSYSEEDVLLYLFETILPKIRALSYEVANDVPPITLREINRFCRELVYQKTRQRTGKSVEESFAEHILQRFRTKGWESIVKIIKEMYKDGLLHSQDSDSVSYMLVRQAFAEEKGGDAIQAVNGIGTKEFIDTQMAEIENELSKNDNDLINSLKEAHGDWEKTILNKKATFLPFFAENLQESKKALSTFRENESYPVCNF